MSWRPTDEWPDGHIVPNPRDVEASLTVAAQGSGQLMPGPGRRMRKLGRSAAAVAQVGLLLAMVLVPAGTFAAKPSSDPNAAATQTTANGKSADAKSKKGSTDTQTAPTADAKGGKGADKTPAKKGNDPTTKGNGGSKDKGSKGNANKPDKSNKGQDKKAAAAAETTPSSPRRASRPSPATSLTTRPAARSS